MRASGPTNKRPVFSSQRKWGKEEDYSVWLDFAQAGSATMCFLDCFLLCNVVLCLFNNAFFLIFRCGLPSFLWSLNYNNRLRELWEVHLHESMSKLLRYKYSETTSTLLSVQKKAADYKHAQKTCHIGLHTQVETQTLTWKHWHITWTEYKHTSSHILSTFSHLCSDDRVLVVEATQSCCQGLEAASLRHSC